MTNQSQNLQEKLEGTNTSQSEKEQKKFLCRLDTSTYRELQSKVLRENNRLKEESTTQKFSERKFEKGSSKNPDEDKRV